MSAGCQPAQLTPGCRLAGNGVRTSVTFETYLRVTSCAVNGMSVGPAISCLPNDPVMYQASFSPQFRITGC